VLTPRDNRQQLPLYADNGGAPAAGTSLDVRPWRVRVLILGATSLVRARSRFRALRGIVALFAALLVSLTLTAAASADVSFTKAYGWGVLDGASQFETCTSTCQGGIAGSGAGQLENYTAVATDSSGDVYVADEANERIDEFSAAGAFIKAYGWGVSDGASQFETCTTTCQAGIQGGAAGQLFIPWGVATDSSGDVYVSDLGNERIDEFSAAGAFIEAYGSGVSDGASRFETCTTTCETGGASGGDGAGALANPDGIATDPSGNVYVAGDDNRIDEFSAAGAPSTTSTSLSSIGSPADGQTFSLNQSPLKPKATPKAISATAAFSLPSAKQCVSKRKFTIHVRKLPGITWVSAVIKINGKRVKSVGRAHITALVNLVGLPKGTFVLSITARASNGQSVTGTRTYHTCVPKSKSHDVAPRL
jgi:NHL repeat